MTTQAAPFQTFPEFSKLTYANKQAYDALVKDFPPISDISFGALMTWWNPFEHMKVSMLNGNLVVPYWLPGDDKNSGLSLVGTNMVDESFCELFDHLQEKGDKARLVNVPEFVISSVKYPGMFSFKEQRCYHEYLLETANFWPISNIRSPWKQKIERAVSKVGKSKIVSTSLDLTQQQNKDLLYNSYVSWQPKNINNYGKLEQEALQVAINHAAILDMENLCVSIDDELYGFMLYDITPDGKLAALYGIKATHSKALGFEIIAYAAAKLFAARGVRQVNLNSDYGLLRLRMFMLTLGPTNFFRKYIVEPA